VTLTATAIELRFTDDPVFRAGIALYPSACWRIWCDWGASRIHLLVLEHLRGETLHRRGGKSV